MKLSGRAAGAGALAVLWLGLTLAARPSVAAILAALAAVVLGVVVAAGWPRVGAAAVALLQDLHDWIAESPADRPPPPPEEPDVVGTVMDELLQGLAAELNGGRLVVWDVDREGDVVAPEFALGEPPPSALAAGNPLTWAVEEGRPMRLSPAPAWAHGDVAAAPIDERRAMTVETPPGEGPDPVMLLPGAATLRAVLRLVDRETDARAERERLQRVTGFLRGLSRDRTPEAVPDALAAAAIDLVGGRGALVASWDGVEGVVLARAGQADGPEPGRAFGPGDGDLAHAARSEATIRRAPADAGDRPALAHTGEAWRRGSPYRVVVPLQGPAGGVGGLVAVWGDRAPSDEGVAFLEAMGPLLSLHLQQATDLVRFRDQAEVDALTGLPNRAAFDARLEEEQARFHRYRRPTALLAIDLDHFKRVNDTHGHEAGDTVLRAVAGAVRDTVRDVDLPARYGGEELVVLMQETLVHAAREVAERVREAIADAAIEHEGTAIDITASIGVSACPELAEDPRALFDSADGALYRAKHAGRNRVVVAERRDQSPETRV